MPVLWDKQRNTIVNNESSEIIRMFNSAFDGLTGNDDDYYPEAAPRRRSTRSTRASTTPSTMASTRPALPPNRRSTRKPYAALFESLDWIEDILGRLALSHRRRLTEADWRLFTTLVRFDAVYFGHFKCNIRASPTIPTSRITSRASIATPGVRDTVDIDHIKTHYYWSHTRINPTRIVPVGPDLDFL